MLPAVFMPAAEMELAVVSVSVSIAVYLLDTNVSDGWRSVCFGSRGTSPSPHYFLSNFLTRTTWYATSVVSVCLRDLRRRRRRRRLRRRPPFYPKRNRNCYWFYISLNFVGCLCFMKCALGLAWVCLSGKQTRRQSTDAALRGSRLGGSSVWVRRRRLFFQFSFLFHTQKWAPP